jgi:YgiT-type zinc finger domain-containing protein
METKFYRAKGEIIMSDSRCSVCGGRYENRMVTVDLYNPQNQLIVVNNVPAEVCIQCDDELFTPETTRQLLELSKRPPVPAKTLRVPVYDLAVA